MPQSLAPIPAGVPITSRVGTITDFFRLRWQDLINSFGLTPTQANEQVATALTAALATTTLLTTTTAGTYRVVTYLEKTVADGVSSSLTPTLTWTRGGVPLTKVGAALSTDTVGANESYVHEFYADGASAITLAVGYASNTPATMTWSGWATVELLA